MLVHDLSYDEDGTLWMAGVGKSHIAQALGHRACLAGHTVLFTSTRRLLTQLRAARADNSYDRTLLRFSKVEVLIVDDVGLRRWTHDEPLDIYEIIRQRYEHGSLILTSNRNLDETAKSAISAFLRSRPNSAPRGLRSVK